MAIYCSVGRGLTSLLRLPFVAQFSKEKQYFVNLLLISTYLIVRHISCLTSYDTSTLVTVLYVWLGN